MCITKTSSWAYGGTNYPTELEAVKVALTDLGTRFVKEFHSKPLEGMLVLGADITPLRDRYIELTAPTVQGGEGTSEKAGGDPSGDPSASRTLTSAELDASGHARDCHARATGKAYRCNCDRGAEQ